MSTAILPDLFGHETPAPAIYIRRDGAEIVVRFKAGHTCDARCMYATGKLCECSCGGRNHGAGNLPIEEN